MSGTKTKICPTCGREFDPANRARPTAAPGAVAQIKYCSMECKRNRNNKTNYANHKEDIIERVIRNRKATQQWVGSWCTMLLWRQDATATEEPISRPESPSAILPTNYSRKSGKETIMKAGQNVQAVHPVSGQWEKATVVHPPTRVGIQKDRENCAVVRFERDGYQVEQPTLYIEEK